MSQKENRSIYGEPNNGEKVQMALIWVIFTNAIVLFAFVLFSSGILSGDFADGDNTGLSRLIPDDMTSDAVTDGSESDPTDDTDDSATQIKSGTNVSERNTNEVASSSGGEDNNSTDGTGTGKGN